MIVRFSEKITSKLGLGTWQFGGSNYVNGKATGYGDFDKLEALNVIQEALSQGISFFDTSDAYGRGLSESILGDAIKKSDRIRESVIVCTKFGHRETERDVFMQDFSAEWLEKSVVSSLKRLGLDYLDVLLLHSPPDNFDWANYDCEPFEKLIKDGLIRQYGVSSKSVYGAKNVVENGFGSTIELIYNLLDRRAEEVVFGNPKAKDFDFIARVPLASGFLTSKYLSQKPAFSPDDYRSGLNERDLSWMHESVLKLNFLEDLSGGISANALSFCLSNENISTVIPGARNFDQLQSNLHSLSLKPLSSAVLTQIFEVVPDVPAWWKPSK